jgi:flagellar basal body-associated protein FliL
VVIFSPAPAAKSAQKSPVSTAVIVLVAVVAVAVIVGILVFSTFYPVNFHQANPANPANQTNVNKLSFNFQEGKAQSNGLAQDLTDKTGLIAVSAATIQCTNRLSSPS